MQLPYDKSINVRTLLTAKMAFTQGFIALLVAILDSVIEDNVSLALLPLLLSKLNNCSR